MTGPQAVYRPNVKVPLLWKTLQSIPGDVVLFVAVAVIVGTVTQDPVLGAASGVIVAAVPTLIGILWAKKKWGSKEYRVYEGRIEEEVGVFSTEKRNVPFDQITDLTQQQSAVESVFGVGDVKINTAGSGSKAIVMKYLPDPDRAYDDIRTRAQMD